MYHLKIAEISTDSVAKIKDLEAEFGFHIMAFEPGYQFAQPNPAQLSKLQELEKELGVTLLAYTPE
ncbi:MAG: hypothetical protein JW757_11365 [Anaerolineales bacterium]|nr:hypothetical protein [Anaerolineales bacterium]